MINIQITSRDFEVDEKITRYLDQKIGKLDKFLPNGEVQAHVVLELDPNGREDNQCVCEVVINAPRERLFAREATVNMYAAIDICEAKLKAQALKYKDKHDPGKNRRRGFMAKVWTQRNSQE